MALAAIFYNGGATSTIGWESYALGHIAQMKADSLGYTTTWYNTYGLDEAGITSLIDTITNATLTAAYICCTTDATHAAGVMTHDQVAYLDVKMITASKGTVVTSGTAASNSTVTDIVLASTASASNDTYNGMYIKTAGVTAVYRKITDYTGSSKTAIVVSTGTAITTTETYIVFTLNKVYVIGDAVSNENALRYGFRTLYSTKQIPLFINLLGGYGTGFEQAVEVTVTATSANTTSLTHTSHFSAIDCYKNKWVGIESGTLGVGQVRQISSNTVSVLTVPLWTAPTGTIVYTICDTYEYCLAHKYLPFAFRTYLSSTSSDVHAIWMQLIDKYGTLSKSNTMLVGDTELLRVYIQRGKCIFDADTLGVV
jgi:hypothetical protein